MRVAARILAGDEVRSPMTDRRATVLAWFFSHRYSTASGGREGITRDAYSLRFAGCLAPPWIRLGVDGAIVRVDTAGLRARIASSEWDGIVPSPPLPDVFRGVPVDATNANLRYGERWLAAGDTVVLRATVSRVIATSAAYRGDARAPQAEYEVTGPVLLDDTVGTDLEVASGHVTRLGFLGYRPYPLR